VFGQQNIATDKFLKKASETCKFGINVPQLEKHKAHLGVNQLLGFYLLNACKTRGRNLVQF
jgi:hypothetical protein